MKNNPFEALLPCYSDSESDFETTDHTRWQSIQTTESPPESAPSKVSKLVANITENSKEFSSDFLSLPNRFQIFDDELLDINQKFTLNSLDSDIMGQDLLLNENIEVILENNEEIFKEFFTSVSMNYTVTDMVEISSIFKSFNWQSQLLKSLPQNSNEEMWQIGIRSFFTQDPCASVERIDLDPHRIFEEISKEYQKIDEIIEEDIEIPENREINTKFETNQVKCGCSNCDIF